MYVLTFLHITNWHMHLEHLFISSITPWLVLPLKAQLEINTKNK